MLRLVEKPVEMEEGAECSTLDELAREGARRMLVEALKREVQEYVEAASGDRDDDGRALVVRNG